MDGPAFYCRRLVEIVHTLNILLNRTAALNFPSCHTQYNFPCATFQCMQSYTGAKSV